MTVGGCHTAFSTTEPVDKLAGVSAPALFPPALAAYIAMMHPAPKVATPPRVGYTAWKPAHKDDICPF
jgi:hypothetical protein